MSAAPSLLVALLSGLIAGVPLSIPPGPAGVIILHLSLRGARLRALRALGALLAVELLAMAAGVLFFRGFTALAARPAVRLAAGLYLGGFALLSWRAVGREQGFPSTSAWTVFRITLTNPTIWIGAASMLTFAPGDLEGGLLLKILFVAGLELGSLAWYLSVIYFAGRIPASWRHGIERAALLVIWATGVYFAGTAAMALLRG